MAGQDSKTPEETIRLISSEYQAMTERALASWKADPEPGEIVPDPHATGLLGLSSGVKFRPVGELGVLVDELADIAKKDDCYKVVSPENLHFTFLALAPHRFAAERDLPPETTSLRRISAQYLPKIRMKLGDLRLVPLANTLLLAGIPDISTHKSRAEYAAALMESVWRPFLAERYGKYPIPPLIWHTTLARYQRKRFDSKGRELYRRNADKDFGALDLGSPRLAAVTFDWSVARFLD
jgi:hypothetical protein